VGKIKSQKIIANIQSLREKLKREKLMERGEFNYNISEYKWASLCLGFLDKMVIPLHIGRDLLFIQVISTR